VNAVGDFSIRHKKLLGLAATRSGLGPQTEG